MPLATKILRTHLSGETHIGLYPLLDGDLCSWLAADFDAQPNGTFRPVIAYAINLALIIVWRMPVE